MTFNYLNNLHRKLRKYRYFYYIKHESLISDFMYDMLEKRYLTGCNKFNIPEKERITNFVGFNIGIPMNLSQHYLS